MRHIWILLLFEIVECFVLQSGPPTTPSVGISPVKILSQQHPNLNFRSGLPRGVMGLSAPSAFSATNSVSRFKPQNDSAKFNFQPINTTATQYPLFSKNTILTTTNSVITESTPYESFSKEPVKVWKAPTIEKNEPKVSEEDSVLPESVNISSSQSPSTSTTTTSTTTSEIISSSTSTTATPTTTTITPTTSTITSSDTVTTAGAITITEPTLMEITEASIQEKIFTSFTTSPDNSLTSSSLIGLTSSELITDDIFSSGSGFDEPTNVSVASSTLTIPVTTTVAPKTAMSTTVKDTAKLLPETISSTSAKPDKITPSSRSETHHPTIEHASSFTTLDITTTTTIPSTTTTTSAATTTTTLEREKCGTVKELNCETPNFDKNENHVRCTWEKANDEIIINYACDAKAQSDGQTEHVVTQQKFCEFQVTHGTLFEVCYFFSLHTRRICLFSSSLLD